MKCESLALITSPLASKLIQTDGRKSPCVPQTARFSKKASLYYFGVCVGWGFPQALWTRNFLF